MGNPGNCSESSQGMGGEANKNNVSRMLSENEINQVNELPRVVAIQEHEEAWKILVD